MSLKGGTFNGIVKMMYCSYTHFVNFFHSDDGGADSFARGTATI